MRSHTDSSALRRAISWVTVVLFLWSYSVPVRAGEPVGDASPVSNNNSATTPIPNSGNNPTVAGVNAQLAGIVNGMNNWLGSNAHDYQTLNTLYRTLQSNLGHGATTVLESQPGFNNMQSVILDSLYTVPAPNGGGDPIVGGWHAFRSMDTYNDSTKTVTMGAFQWRLDSINRIGQQIFRTTTPSNLAMLAENTEGTGTPSALYLYNYANGSLSSDYVAGAGGNVVNGLTALTFAVFSNVQPGYSNSAAFSNVNPGTFISTALSTDISVTGLRTSGYFDDRLTNYNILPNSVLTAGGDINHAAMANLKTYFYGNDGIPNGEEGDNGQPGTFEQGHINGPGPMDPEALGTGWGAAFWSLDWLFGRFNSVLNTRAQSLFAESETFVTESGGPFQVNWKIQAVTPGGNNFYNFLSSPFTNAQRGNVGIERDSQGNIVRIVDGNLTGLARETVYNADQQTTADGAIAALRQKLFNEIYTVPGGPMLGGPTPGPNPGPGDPFFGYNGSNPSPAPNTGPGGFYGPGPGNMGPGMDSGFMGPGMDGGFMGPTMGPGFDGGVYGPGPNGGMGMMGPMGPMMGPDGMGPGSFMGPGMDGGFMGPMMGPMGPGPMGYMSPAGGFFGPNADGGSFGPGMNSGYMSPGSQGFGPGMMGPAGMMFDAAGPQGFDSAGPMGPMDAGRFSDMAAAFGMGEGPGGMDSGMFAGFMSSMMGNAEGGGMGNMGGMMGAMMGFNALAPGNHDGGTGFGMMGMPGQGPSGEGSGMGMFGNWGMSGQGPGAGGANAMGMMGTGPMGTSNMGEGAGGFGTRGEGPLGTEGMSGEDGLNDQGFGPEGETGSDVSGEGAPADTGGDAAAGEGATNPGEGDVGGPAADGFTPGADSSGPSGNPGVPATDTGAPGIAAALGENKATTVTIDSIDDLD